MNIVYHKDAHDEYTTEAFVILLITINRARVTDTTAGDGVIVTKRTGSSVFSGRARARIFSS